MAQLKVGAESDKDIIALLPTDSPKTEQSWGAACR